MKPGGTFTQPHYPPGEDAPEFVAYVEWSEIGRYATPEEAVTAIKWARIDCGTIIEIDSLADTAARELYRVRSEP